MSTRTELAERVEQLERENKELVEALQSAVDHCEGWRKFQEDPNAVPSFPRILEDTLRAALARAEPARKPRRLPGCIDTERVGDCPHIHNCLTFGYCTMPKPDSARKEGASE